MAGRMIGEGASILDIGGMSTRPGSTEISVTEELDRVIPVIESVKKAFPDTIVSVDTYRSVVAEAAIRAGAGMINDISGGQLDHDLWPLVSKHPVAYILMHLKGTPRDMMQYAEYQDVISDLLKYFIQKIRELKAIGIEEIVIDPGFGFAKNPAQNYKLIRRLNSFGMFGLPVMIGLSRKSTLSKTIDRPVDETLYATTALHMAALMNGASILRVHDIQPAMDAIRVYQELITENHE
jgi:dihydropteroate synthase